MSYSALFEKAIAAIDAINAQDPTPAEWQGEQVPWQLLESRRIFAWTKELDPNASEPLLLAARCQHIERWKVPRTTFPQGRVGYLQWRNHMAKVHAQVAGEVLASIGYDAEFIARVQFLNRKKQLKTDPDTQTLEDALCVAFLELQLENFATRHPEGKVVEILQKTWGKMSEKGQAVALAMPLPEQVGRWLRQALQDQKC